MRLLPPFTWACAALAAVLAAGCATPPAAPDAIAEWQPLAIPGKQLTRYEWAEKEGRRAVMASSERSASMWRKRLKAGSQRAGEVHFSWWVQDLVPSADLADADLSDSPARVLFGFAGDVGSLPLRDRMMFDLVEALTGEQPPYATLGYVWDSKLPVGTVVHNPRTGRMRSIVVDSGPAQLRRWRDHQRDLVADFKLAFGEDPGTLTSIALMTDSDNTGSQARAWYGPVELH
jgi:hypothetical protein